MKRKIFIGIPALHGKVTPQTQTALACANIEAAGLGWELQEYRWSRDSIITHARNVLLAKFRDSGADEMLWVDSDLGWGPGVFTRLMHHRGDIIAGAYRTKNETERYPVRTFHNPLAWIDGASGLMEVESVPLGFCRMSRAAAEGLAEADKDKWFYAASDEKIKCVGVFETGLVDNVYWGEDFFVCRKWRALGGKVYVDPELPLHHVGDDGTLYSGVYGNWLRKQDPVASAPIVAARPELSAAIDLLRQKWASGDMQTLFAAAAGETQPFALLDQMGEAAE